MRAVIFREHGGPENLYYTYVETPEPGPHEVLVQVKASSINHLDIWNLKGLPGVKIPLPHIPGCDIAGVVVAKGSKVHGVPFGKPVVVTPGLSCGKCEHCRSGWDSLCPQYRIVGFQADGGWAEYVKVPKESVIRVSSRLSFEEWAAVPLVFMTAWHMLVTRARLRKGERVLIHAAGSGVGSAAVQVAKLLGARVIATAGSDEKVRLAKTLGADEVINYRKKDFAAEVKRITRNVGADVVFEHTGPETFAGSLASLSKKGRLVTCGATSGPSVQIDLRTFFARQLTVMGSYMGGARELREVLSLVRNKKLRPVIDKVYAFREVRTAVRRMLDRANFGKIILTP